jgi:hypothetical protein
VKLKLATWLAALAAFAATYGLLQSPYRAYWWVPLAALVLGVFVGGVVWGSRSPVVLADKEAHRLFALGMNYQALKKWLEAAALDPKKFNYRFNISVARTRLWQLKEALVDSTQQSLCWRKRSHFSLSSPNNEP